MATLNYLELPTKDIGASKRFYAGVFEWDVTDFGPSYAATTSGDTDVGFQADAAEQTEHALPVIEVDDLEKTLDRVGAAGGTITRPIFGFPGGRRFQFRDPDGHELAVTTLVAE